MESAYARPRTLGVAKDRLRRSGVSAPSPGLRLRLAGDSPSPPPFRASSPRRTRKAAFGGTRNSTKTNGSLDVQKKIVHKSQLTQVSTNPKSKMVCNLPFVDNCQLCTFLKPNFQVRAFVRFRVPPKAAFRVRRCDETRRVRRGRRGGRGVASSPFPPHTAHVADRRHGASTEFVVARKRFPQKTLKTRECIMYNGE